MSQHDYDIANQAFAATRADINAALQALVTNSSGAAEPATTFAYMWWADTTAGILKQRNAANSGWVSVLNLATGAPVVAPTVPDGSITPAKLSQPPTLGTAVATTSGAAIDFTGIPAWAKKITVMLNGVSTNGTSNIIVQLGTSGSFETTGYDGGSWQANTTITAYSTGFMLGNSNAAAANVKETLVLNRFDSATNTYVAFGTGAVSSAGGGNAHVHAGSKSLSGALTRIRITTVNGTDTFDLGSANLLIE